MSRRALTSDEAALWKRVIASVTPLEKKVVKPSQASSPPLPEPERSGKSAGSRAAPPAPPVPTSSAAKAPRALPKPLPVSGQASNTLDGSWDRRLSRGLVSPESSIDLHGHTLSSAYGRLDLGLDLAIQRGDRVLLLITGKPPRPESERPHARGAIRAAVGDWLASSRHADRIAAVRTAHPRHGGSGALYIILRRPKTVPARNS